VTIEVAKLLADRAEDVCRYLLPNGHRKGREWKAGSVDGEAGDSLGVVLAGDKAGVWADFAAGESGDLIGLWQQTRRVDVATAFREAEDWLGIEPRTNGHARPRVAIPAPSHVHPQLGAPSRTWAYTDAYGGILGYVNRYDPPGSRKELRPQTFRDGAWTWKGFDEPRPLYGLERLAARPDAPVLVVEGEKAADAAQELLPGMVAVTWSGGAQAIGKADLAPLRGRVLKLWPDADAPGIEAMRKLAERLDQPCRIIDVEGMSEAWDAADALADGWDSARVQAWAKPRMTEWFPEPKQELEIEVPHETIDLVSAYAPDMIEEHPEPTNLFDKAPLPKLEPRMLPPSLSNFIFDQSQIIGSDPCILAISALVACAAVTSDSLKLQPKQFETGWKECARLWGAFVGDPSVKKTPPLNRATSHLRRLDLQFAEAGEEAVRRYKIAKRVYDAQEKRYIDASAKNQHPQPLPDPPERPAIRRLIVQDATIEAVADVLSDNPQGVLVLFDELSGFFGSMDAYRAQEGKDRSFWLESYNGGPRRIDRIRREARSVPNLSTCILGGIQPAAIRDKAKGMVEDGLLQRFMIVVAESGDAVGEDRRQDIEAAATYRAILDWLSTCEGDPEHPLEFDAGAREVLRRIELQLHEFTRLDRLPMRMRYQLGKWSGLFCRLCLTYHAIACAALGEPVNGQINTFTAERVESLLFEFLFWHLKHFYEDILGDSTGEIDLMHKVARWLIAAAPARFTNWHIAKGVSAWRNAGWTTRRAIMDRLDVCGWVEQAPRGRGSTNLAWNLNPRVHESFGHLAEAEQKRREQAREAIMGSADDKREQAEYE